MPRPERSGGRRGRAEANAAAAAPRKPYIERAIPPYSVLGDADLAIFDPQTVSDRATFQQPAVASTGIPWVIVNGVPVVAEGQLQRNVYPGKAARR